MSQLTFAVWPAIGLAPARAEMVYRIATMGEPKTLDPHGVSGTWENYIVGDSFMGLLTDAGDSTPHIQRMLSGLDALILECNHDLDLLMSGSYPPTLKRRISSRYGHLDNSTAARILCGIDCSRLQHFIAAHLSAQNNTPELARSAAAEALGCEPGWIGIATQSEGLAWRQVS